MEVPSNVPASIRASWSVKGASSKSGWLGYRGACTHLPGFAEHLLRPSRLARGHLDLDWWGLSVFRFRYFNGAVRRMNSRYDQVTKLRAAGAGYAWYGIECWRRQQYFDVLADPTGRVVYVKVYVLPLALASPTD